MTRLLKFILVSLDAQVQQYAETLGFANNRPLQPVNARVVAQ